MYRVYYDKEHRAIADIFLYPSDDEESSSQYMITRINVPREHRSKGIASRLLKRITDDADEEGVVLLLEISPSDGLNYSQLLSWYTKCGFRKICNSSLLERQPR